MSQETEWTDGSFERPQETRLASQGPSDIKAAEAAVAEEWKEGDVILDLYEVKGVLGEGGFGKVYRVHHKNWNIDLAVKTPRIDRLDEAGKENFRNEAETWVNLGLHPHTVSCYYVRDLGGIPRVFAEYVEGGSLADWIEEKRLYEGGHQESLKRILDVAIQFAWGLHHAHEQGLVHQDVKPANVMMTRDGLAKVTDFGLAKAKGGASSEFASIAGESILVESGGLTPAYASPEQSYGKQLSRKTDIWSWAVSVLEMFTGQVTWMSGGVAADVLEEYLESGTDNSEIPDMPRELAECLMRCFEQDPADRPRDMMEVAGELQNIYQKIIGDPYPRQPAKASKALADNLNNRAVSLLDIGKQEEAEKLWKKALQVEPGHIEATYNSGLVRWRAGRLAGGDFIKEMEEARKSREHSWISHYLLGLVHLERGDAKAAIKALESIQEIIANDREVRAALAIARRRASHSRQFEGHTKRVCSVSFSADGKYALSGGVDKTLKLWDVATGRCLRTFKGHWSSVMSVSLSADGKYAFSGGDKTLKTWDVATGECLRAFEADAEGVWSVSVSADGKYALSGGVDKTLKLWELATGRCLRTFEGHTRQVNSVSLSADAKHALSGSDDKKLKLWEVTSGRCLRTFHGHKKGVLSVSLSADGKYAVSGSYDKKLKLWEVTSGRCLRTLDDMEAVASVSLSADGKYAFSGGDKLKLWDLATGRCLRTLEGAGRVSSVSLSADGKYALSGGEISTEVTLNYTTDLPLLKLWDVQSDPLAPFAISQIVASGAAGETEEAFAKSVASAREAFSDADMITAANRIRFARSLIGCERRPDAIKLWTKLYTHLPRRALNGGWGTRTLKGHPDAVRSVCLSTDGRYALSGSDDRTLKLWDVATGECLRTLKGHKELVFSVSLSADGKYALSGSYDKTLKLWDVTSGECLRTFKGHTGGLQSVSLGGYAKHALSGSHDKTLKLWDLVTGRCLRTFEGHTESVCSVSLSADGKHALSGSHDKTLKLWDVITGQCLRTFEGHACMVNSVSLSADGKYAFSGGDRLKLWDLATGRCLRTFEDDAAWVNSVSLSFDGNYALADYHNTLKLWDVITGQCLRTFEGHEYPVYSVSLSGDAQYALSGGCDHTLKLWMLDWELEDRQPADCDEGAREYLHTFLMQHTPYAYSLPENHEPSEEEITLALSRRGMPIWTDKDFEDLLHTLGCVGFGWLRPEGVRRELEKMASEIEADYAESSLLAEAEGTNEPNTADSTCRVETVTHETAINRPWWKRVWKP